MEALVLKYGLIYLLSIVVLYFCFRRFLYSIFDPFAQILLLFASMIALSSDHWLMTYVILCICAFWLGLFFVFPKKNSFQIINTLDVENILILKLYTYFLYIVYVGSILLVFSKSGIPLFADNPTHAKISVFDNMGFLRRISFIGNIIPINLFLLYMVSKHKRKFLFLLFLFCILKLFQGSKSSFFGIILVAYYLFYVSPLQRLHYISSRTKKFVMRGGILVTILVLIFIVLKEAQLEGSAFIYSLGFRLMEFGDVMIYFKEDNVRAAFNGYNIFTYLYDEVNGILGMLRICPYNYPLGYKMVSEFRGYESETITGPNGIFIVKGLIYFGYIGGIIYSLICGYVFALFRKYFFTMHIRDIFWYSLMFFIFFSLSGFLRESGQFYSLLFDCCFYTFPFLFVSQCLMKKYGKFRLY